jgi:hypothetical protein
VETENPTDSVCKDSVQKTTKICTKKPLKDSAFGFLSTLQKEMLKIKVILSKGK